MNELIRNGSPSERGSVLFRQLFSYGVIGVVSALLDTTVFWVLTTRTVTPPQAANVVGISCGITLSFVLNRAFTFSARDRTLQRFAIFVAVGLCGMALSAAILAIGIRLGFALMPIKLFSVVVVAIVQFTLNRTITFRTGRLNQTPS